MVDAVCRIADILVQVCVRLHVGARRILRSPECVERGHRDQLPGDPKGGACGPHVLWIREIVRIDERRCQRVTRRSEERRVGKAGGSTCRSRWSQYHTKNKKDTSHRALIKLQNKIN